MPPITYNGKQYVRGKHVPRSEIKVGMTLINEEGVVGNVQSVDTDFLMLNYDEGTLGYASGSPEFLYEAVEVKDCSDPTGAHVGGWCCHKENKQSIKIEKDGTITIEGAIFVTNKKPTPSLMSTLVAKVKKLLQSDDEKLLRKHEVLMEDGSLTTDGKDLVMLKAFEYFKPGILADLKKIEEEEKE